MNTPSPKQPPARILAVEDESDIAALVAYHLTREGYRVHTAGNGEEALTSVREIRPDLVVLDLMLPGHSGYAVLEEIRRGPDTRMLPVIVLTARREEDNRVKGFELGADDYITKPFSPDELVLRIRAVLRRARALPHPGTRHVLRGGPIAVDLDALRVTVNDREIETTPTEYRLLATLLERRGRVQGREQLLSDVWDLHVAIETRTVDMHIKRLRKKLGDAADWIETVRGFGYRFRHRPGR